jgi:hypothetical protein
MKTFRLGFALIILLGFVAVSNPFADDEEGAKCDCWYWQSNKHGVVKSTTVDGKTTESCDTSAKCTPPQMME